MKGRAMAGHEEGLAWPPASKPRADSPRDLLDSLLGPHALHDLKPLPLPPFTGYTGHLSINGISGHHYHAIAQRLPEENNNFPSAAFGDHDVVSSSTCAADADALDDDGFPADVKMFAGSPRSPDAFGNAADSCTGLVDCQPKTETYDISSIEDIAAIIGSAIADTTVPSRPEDPDQLCSRDSWMDLDAWIEGACGQHDERSEPPSDALAEFVLPHSPQRSQNDFTGKLDFQCKSNQELVARSQEFLQKNIGATGSTLQTLLTHGYMPLLQNRLQNGPPKQEAPSSTSYGLDVISTTSPPGNVVSTTDNLLLNGRYAHHYSLGLEDSGRSTANYPHTTTVTPTSSKSRRNRSQKKQSGGVTMGGLTFPTAAELGGLLGKEKPVHRCNICNRGFLNKSNIKVHLRTHTGEKPFRCDVCAKAFRQKAHLIKHQQIHKRIGRD